MNEDTHRNTFKERREAIACALAEVGYAIFAQPLRELPGAHVLLVVRRDEQLIKAVQR